MQIVAIAVVAVAAPEGTAVYVAYLADHTAEIRAGWVEGCEWLCARRAALARVDARGCARRLLLWALEHVLRPHGHHRRAVTT